MDPQSERKPDPVRPRPEGGARRPWAAPRLERLGHMAEVTLKTGLNPEMDAGFKQGGG